MVAEAPEQWYTFKPMWPDDAAEEAELRSSAPRADDDGAVERRAGP